MVSYISKVDLVDVTKSVSDRKDGRIWVEELCRRLLIIIPMREFPR